MNPQSKKFLLKLARQTLEHYFSTEKKLEIHESELPDEELKQKRGTFVTLHKAGELRGCIGRIEPVQEIYKDIIDNALSAAFHDPRFLPLAKDELAQIDREISVLTKPEILEYFSAEELMNKLQPLKHGVIIKKGFYSATYLPQVWEDLSDRQEFLTSLCMKAGLSPEEWKRGDLEVLTYEAEVFKELG